MAAPSSLSTSLPRASDKATPAKIITTPAMTNGVTVSPSSSTPATTAAGSSVEVSTATMPLGSLSDAPKVRLSVEVPTYSARHDEPTYHQHERAGYRRLIRRDATIREDEQSIEQCAHERASDAERVGSQAAR